MSVHCVRKAVIPAAGFGTRFLPFTKAVSKEMIPLIDRPVIQYVVEEAVASGIEEVLFIISDGKEEILEHFRPHADLENRLMETGKSGALAEVRRLDRMMKMEHVYQKTLDGLGDAIRYAEDFASGEPFAVLLGDTVMDSDTDRPVVGQVIDVYEKFDGPAVALEQVPRDRVSKYGIAAGNEVAEGVLRLSGMVEKPSPDKAPSDLAFAARYVFDSDIFDALREIGRGKNNEVQLTDAMAMVMANRPFYGCRISGRRYDIGDKLTFLKSTVEFGLRREEFSGEFKKYLAEIMGK
ncbi:MAG: UTP--glucose-1-phosphate uridylyltransferase [Victivallaceae bacterium]|nr:UTP--glucose-1-phosphate uridylyltransferase [Victivallaceae bacterium]